MTDFISQISSAQTLSAVLFILVLVVGMLGIIIWQQLRIKKMKGPEQPKYGFLGKPLYSVLALAVLVGGVGLTWYNLSHGTEQVTVQADESVKVDVTYEVKETETGKQLLLNVIPTYKGIAWGGQSAYKFDAFWTIKSTSKTWTEVEPELDINDVGGISIPVSSGSYTVDVDVVFEERVWTESITVTI